MEKASVKNLSGKSITLLKLRSGINIAIIRFPLGEGWTRVYWGVSDSTVNRIFSLQESK